MRNGIARFVLAGCVLVLGLLAPLGRQSSAADPPQVKFDTPTQLAKVLLPPHSYGLAWSADGAYLAAGPSVVDTKKATIKATLKVPWLIEGLAFSPDRKWLAAATGQPVIDDKAPPAELFVFDVPAFTRKFTAKLSGNKKHFFIDFAWSPDGKSLYAIEGSGSGKEKNQVRRWAVPAFTEQAAIQIPQSNNYPALAVSPDGKTLVVADRSGELRLFDLPSGAERTSFKIAPEFDRLGFAPDCKKVAVFDKNRLSWFDATTGKPEKPNPAPIALQTASRSANQSPYSPDRSKRVQEWEKHPTIIFQRPSKTEHGVFIRIVDTATDKTWNWRVGEGGSAGVQFSPDGTKLAGRVRFDGLDEWLMIWAVPK